jgi:hypothetical protein
VVFCAKNAKGMHKNGTVPKVRWSYLLSLSFKGLRTFYKSFLLQHKGFYLHHPQCLALAQKYNLENH